MAAVMNESPFWHFSVRFYALPEVAPACLELQDEADVDVNLLLYLLFLAEQRRALSEPEIADLDRAIQLWRDEVVKPLRALRRRLKGGFPNTPFEWSEGFRLSLKRLELDAERVEQQLLEREDRHGEEASGREEAARQSLHAYGTFLKAALPEAPLAIILSAFAAHLPI